MDVLLALLKKLDISSKCLKITDHVTGAGYIVDQNDNVFCRWGHIYEGIAILEAYNESCLLYRDAASELYDV